MKKYLSEKLQRNVTIAVVSALIATVIIVCTFLFNIVTNRPVIIATTVVLFFTIVILTYIDYLKVKTLLVENKYEMLKGTFRIFYGDDGNRMFLDLEIPISFPDKKYYLTYSYSVSDWSRAELLDGTTYDIKVYYYKDEKKLKKGYYFVGIDDLYLGITSDQELASSCSTTSSFENLRGKKYHF